MSLSATPCLFAVHIADNVLAWPWLAGGWLLAGLFLLFGGWRIRDDEVPRVALLTAAFFVASSIHVRLGPGSAHLLLNGLLGVVLGWRAALAIPIGVAMQALLMGHGGFSTIGINSCIMTAPAFLAGPLFAGLRRAPGAHRLWFRVTLVGISALVLTLSLVNAGALLYSQFANGQREMDPALAYAVTIHPVTLGCALLLAIVAALLQRRLDTSPEFPLGLLVGEVSVIATVALHCGVLILGGESNWQVWAVIDLIVHLPIAVLEGVVLGFVVSFLARVKPEMLGWQPPPVLTALPLDREAADRAGQNGEAITTTEKGVQSPGQWPRVLGLLIVLGFPSTSLAHKLEAGAVLRPGWQVQIESWFETKEPAAEAAVRVFGAKGEQRIEGQLDHRGIFIFSYQHVEPLRIVVNAGGGHRAEVRIAADTLMQHTVSTSLACVQPTPAPFLAAPLLVPVRLRDAPSPAPLVERNTGMPLQNLIIGVGLLVGIAAMAVQWGRLRRRDPRVE
jgi:cobalt/nickel transport system permease protein